MNQTINVSLPKGLVDLAKQQVASGYYSSVSEVIRDALRKFTVVFETPTIQLSKRAQKDFEQARREHDRGETVTVKSFSEYAKMMDNEDRTQSKGKKKTTQAFSQKTRD